MVHISREEADSHFSETEETQLATLACVAFVNQQQREPFGSPDANGREDEDDESLSDAATDTAVIVAGSSDDGFKKQFLDRLAEVFAPRTVPVNFVSCTTLCEDENNVTIFVSWNTEVAPVDVKFRKV